MEYFSDRERINDNKLWTENISSEVWNGIIAVVNSLIIHNYLAKDYPRKCPDGRGIYETDVCAFYKAAKANIPALKKLLSDSNFIDVDELVIKRLKSDDSKYAILDFIEFVYVHINDVENGEYHSFYNHYELNFIDTTCAKGKYIDDINTIFKRNNIAFTLDGNGQIQRVLDKTLVHLIEETKEPQERVIREYLKIAAEKIRSPKIDERKIALDKLWDAYERVKAFDASKKEEKSSSVNSLLDRVSNGNTGFRNLLDKECQELNGIGNTYTIRHSEKYQSTIDTPEHIDYLFFRLYSTMNLLLTGINSSNDK